tara:strand:- start:278 stop:550 length:273 start_codon:yes stop_codon:yes gene_type:complete
LIAKDFLSGFKKRKKAILNSYLSFQKVLSQAGPAASASYSLIASILLFIFIGFYIDDRFETSPFGIIIGMVLGLVVGFYQMVKIAKYKIK